MSLTYSKLLFSKLLFRIKMIKYPQNSTHLNYETEKYECRHRFSPDSNETSTTKFELPTAPESNFSEDPFNVKLTNCLPPTEATGSDEAPQQKLLNSSENGVPVCMICFRSTKGAEGFSNYGLLPHCQHWACSDCINTWSNTRRREGLQ